MCCDFFFELKHQNLSKSGELSIPISLAFTHLSVSRSLSIQCHLPSVCCFVVSLQIVPLFATHTLRLNPNHNWLIILIIVLNNMWYWWDCSDCKLSSFFACIISASHANGNPQNLGKTGKLWLLFSIQKVMHTVHCHTIYPGMTVWAYEPADNKHILRWVWHLVEVFLDTAVNSRSCLKD